MLKLSLVILLSLFVPLSDQVDVHPEKAQPGEELTIIFTPDAEEFSHPGEEVYVKMLHWEGTQAPFYRKERMSQTSSGWEYSFRLDNEELSFIQFKISGSKSGDYGQDRQLRSILIHGENMNVLPKSHKTAGYAHIFGLMSAEKYPRTSMLAEPDPVEGYRKFLKAYQQNPEDLESAWWYVWSAKEIKSDNIEKGKLADQTVEFADNVLDSNPDEPYAMAAYALAQQQFGNRQKGMEVSDELISAYPAHPATELFRAWRCSYPPTGMSAETRITYTQEFINDFPDTNHNVVLDVLLPSYVQLDKFEEAWNWLENYEYASSEMYQYLGNKILEKNGSPELAVQSVERAFEKWKMTAENGKPPYLTEDDWQHFLQSEKRTLKKASLYTDWADALLKADEPEKAIAPAKMVYELRKEQDNAEADNLAVKVFSKADPLYVKALAESERFEEALEVGKDLILSERNNDVIIDAMKEAYTGKNNSANGFTEFIDSYKKRALQKRFAGEMINEPAPDFTLDQLLGDQVTLSDLKGKVVVLDFWALWCGPCKEAFPYLQEVTEHYSDRSDVKVFALNTMENITGNERVDKVSEFMEQNGYTFNVLFDYNRRAVANKFEVSGIPTRFIIGPDNKIQFKEVGNTGEKMVQEMIVQIDMLLESQERASK